jgi:hypothetical protein
VNRDYLNTRRASVGGMPRHLIREINAAQLGIYLPKGSDAMLLRESP